MTPDHIAAAANRSGASPLVLIVSAAILSGLASCAPTIHVKVDPITINAKLDADVRIRLDKEVQSAIAANPDIF